MAHRFLWLTPFLLFVSGYYTMSLLIGAQTLETPSLAGQNLRTVAAHIAPYGLSLRILGEVEEPTLPDGTVISQSPSPGQKIKFYQSIGIVISRVPPLPHAPNVIGMTKKEIRGQTAARIKGYPLASHAPIDTCIAQFPAAGSQLHNKTMLTYISGGTTPTRLMPDVRSKSLNEVVECLKSVQLTANVAYTDSPGEANQVTGQKPAPGSIIDLRSNPVIQLHVIR